MEPKHNLTYDSFVTLRANDKIKCFKRDSPLKNLEHEQTFKYFENIIEKATNFTNIINIHLKNLGYLETIFMEDTLLEVRYHRKKKMPDKNTFFILKKISKF